MSASAIGRDALLDVLDHWSARGWLRRLDVALARFVATLPVEPAVDAPTLLAIAVAAQLEGQGHPCVVVADVVADPAGVLGWPADGIDAFRHVLGSLAVDDAAHWLATLRASAVVASADRGTLGDVGATPFVVDEGRFALARYWRHERRIADAVRARTATPLAVDEASARRWIARLFDRRDGDAGPDWQKVACALALRSRFAIVTGGPGTGKTYTAARLLALLLATSPDPGALRIALAAPTGKAAARLRRSIDDALGSLTARLGDELPLAAFVARIGPARTLHRLLGTRRGTRRFVHDAADPLDVDAVIVDEASMIHVEMMDALIGALPPHARLVLLGDRDQLASVEAGAVLGELCRDAAAGRYVAETARYVEAVTDEALPAAFRDDDGPPLAQHTTMLRRAERYGGAIGRLAEAVRTGRTADVRAALATDDPSIAWHRDAAADDAVAAGVRGYARFVDALAARPTTLFVEDHAAWVRTVLDAFERFRVLCAVRDGPWGIETLGHAIETRLAATGGLPAAAGWYAGRPVIATRNDYDVGVFNGDVGVALPASSHDGRLRAWFADGDGVRSVAASRLSEVETAFAMTVHRAQGSEFDGVVLALPADGGRVATRELLYTGVTRARVALTLVTARPDVVDDAVARTTRRSSGLVAMLGDR